MKRSMSRLAGLVVLLFGFCIINVTMLAWRILATTQRLTLRSGRGDQRHHHHHHHHQPPARDGESWPRHRDRECAPLLSIGRDESAASSSSSQSWPPPLRLSPRPDPCCLGRPGTVFLLLLVTSSPRQFPVRQAIRETWGGVGRALPGGGRVRTRFLLGLGGARRPATQALIEAENRRHGDIVQGDFEDVYRNLTLKTVVGIRWAAQHCAAAAFVMKTDSDVYVNVEAIARYLSDASLPSKLVIGDVGRGQPPSRSRVHKWYVSEREYPHDTYPDYPRGTGYVVSGAVASLLVDAFRVTPPFVWEDVYAGLCLRRLGVRLVDDWRFHTDGVRIRRNCDVAARFIVHGVKHYRLKAYQKMHQLALASKNCSLG